MWDLGQNNSGWIGLQMMLQRIEAGVDVLRAVWCQSCKLGAVVGKLWQMREKLMKKVAVWDQLGHRKKAKFHNWKKKKKSNTKWDTCTHMLWVNTQNHVSTVCYIHCFLRENSLENHLLPEFQWWSGWDLISGNKSTLMHIQSCHWAEDYGD